MTTDASKLINLTLKHGGFVTYGDNNKVTILGGGDVSDKDSLNIKDVLSYASFQIQFRGKIC